MSTYSVIVLTGGYGTRLKAVLKDKPKILAPINNKPFLDYFVSWLKLSGACLDDVIFCAGHLGDQISRKLDTDYPAYKVLIEDNPCGTFRALMNSTHLACHEDLLVLNGDTIFECSFLQWLIDILVRTNVRVC